MEIFTLFGHSDALSKSENALDFSKKPTGYCISPEHYIILMQEIAQKISRKNSREKLHETVTPFSIFGEIFAHFSSLKTEKLSYQRRTA